ICILLSNAREMPWADSRDWASGVEYLQPIGANPPERTGPRLVALRPRHGQMGAERPFVGESYMKTLGFLIVVGLVAQTAFGQVEQVRTPPPNLVVPNYDMVPVGPFGGLEGPAHAARVDDPSAAWFNPAGLARQMSAQISGSAGVYSHTAVSPQSLPN